jgi:dolichyl-phosphate-mannose-protein mannosyltransferase
MSLLLKKFLFSQMSSSDSGFNLNLKPRETNEEHKQSFFKSIFVGREKKEIEMNEIDACLLLIFLFIGMFSRFFRIQFPRYVVFDEVYFGSFTNYYYKSEFFFDIHPPLGKLILTLGCYVQNYRGDINFENLSRTNEKYLTTEYVSLRAVSAFFAGFCTPLSYILARVAGCSRFSSTIVGLLVCADHVMIVCGRFILTDSILHFFSIATVLMILINDNYNNALTLTLEGIFMGLSCSCEFTAGGIVLFAFIKEFVYAFSCTKYQRRAVVFQAYFRCCYLTVLVLCVMIGLTCVHLELVPYKPKDHRAFIPPCIKGSLVDKINTNWTERANAKPLLYRAASLLMYQFASSADKESKHPYSSKWYTWPLLTGKWVLFWTSDERIIACVGNPFMYYAVFVIFCITLYDVILNRKWNTLQGSILIGYLSCLLPFALVKRETFLYHYVLPLLFGIWQVGIFLDTLSPKLKGFMTVLIGCLAIIGYFFLAPLSYGLEELDFDFIIWNRKWR